MAALGVTFPHGRVTGDAAEHTHEHTKKEKNTRGRKQEAQRGSTHHPEPSHLAFLHGTLLIFPMCLPAFSLWALQGKPSPLCFASDPTPLTAPFSLKVKEPKASLKEGDGNIGTYFVVGTAHTVQGKVGNELPQNPQSQTLVPDPGPTLTARRGSRLPGCSHCPAAGSCRPCLPPAAASPRPPG